MHTSASKEKLEQLGTEIFELSQLSSLARAQARSRDVETLTETENLTLDLLSRRDSMTVGQIQKSIGVLPAQMSRIIRALENKGDEAYVACRINADDRRKIDVQITPAGKRALDAYRGARLKTTTMILGGLSDEERDQFMQTLRKIRVHIQELLRNRSAPK